MGVLHVGTAKADPGELSFGSIVAGNHPAGGELGIPITIINGTSDGPVLWINACIHGDEPQGTLTTLFLTQDVKPEQLKGALVLVPAMNVPGFEAHKRGNPLDMFSYDMNRIYPGNSNGRFTERLAWAHREALVANADMEISIHSGGDHSFLDKTIFRAPSDESLELAQAMGPGWDLLLLSPHPKGSPMAELHDQGKAAISVELGGSCHYMPQDFRSDGRELANAVLNIMYHYGMIEGEPSYESKWYTGSQIAVLAENSGLWLAEEDFEFKKSVKADTVLAKIYDLRGNVLESIKAPCDGMAFGLRTTPPTHAGDWAVFFGNIDNEITSLVHEGRSL